MDLFASFPAPLADIGKGAVGGALTFLGQWLYSRANKPRLIAYAQPGDPFRQIRQVSTGESGTWLRVYVHNAGRSTAKNVRLFLRAPASRRSYFSGHPVPEGDLIPLDWSYQVRETTLDIPNGTGFFADLMLVGDLPAGSVLIELKSAVQPLKMLDMLRTAGTVRLEFLPVSDGEVHKPSTAVLNVGTSQTQTDWI